MPRPPPKRLLTVPPTRIGVVDVPSTGTSFRLQLVLPRLLARLFPASTASSRKQPIDCTILPPNSDLSIVVLHSVFRRTTSRLLILSCALRGRRLMKRSRRPSKRPLKVPLRASSGIRKIRSFLPTSSATLRPLPLMPALESS